MVMVYGVLSAIILVMIVVIIVQGIRQGRYKFDELTKLKKHNQLENILSNHEKINREQTIILISINNFKHVNDVYGSNTGDEILVLIGDFLKNIVGNSVYRYSGDEFVALIDNSYNAKEISQTILKRFDEPWNVGKLSSLISASVGSISVHSCLKSKCTMDEIVNYFFRYIKNKGKGKLTIFDSDLYEKVELNKKIKEIFRNKQEEQYIDVYYHPIYNADTKKVIMIEALMRVSDEAVGVIKAEEFIKIAEETGKIIDLGNLVIDKACNMFKNLSKDKNIEAVTVNVSKEQLVNKQFIPYVLNVLNQNGMNTTNLKIEIPDELFFTGSGHDVEKAINELNKVGIGVFLDGFGKGFSNPSKVLKIPFECIKLSKNLIVDSEKDNKAYILMSALGIVFTESGSKVLIHGIENDELKEIADLLCMDYVQGYYFSYPLDEKEIIKYVNEN